MPGGWSPPQRRRGEGKGSARKRWRATGRCRRCGRKLKGKGPHAGQANGLLIQGTLQGVTSTVAGDSAGTDPTGSGSARWTGIAEAASPRSFERRTGTATIGIADLSDPRVTVDVQIAGNSIGSPAWTGMELDAGSYGTGTHGTDYLKGGLYGPRHQETYGVFDTGTYVGAFGAKRQ